MNPTIKVSIGGMAFYLEESAYRLLKQYLDRLQEHYENVEGGKEIIEDIELRINELLRERISSPEQAISENIIKEVISILGEPEEQESNEQAHNIGFSKKNKKDYRKKLYRDTENRVIGGVCSGLAAYFNIDVVLVRVLFVVFFIGFSALSLELFGFSGGTTVLAYVILWIAMPAARTVQQRYEMRGKTPNIQNIQEKVEKELREAGRSLEKSAPAFSKIFYIFGRIFLVFFSVILIIIAVSVLLAFLIALLSSHSIINALFIDLMNYVDVSWHPGWFFGLLAALLFLPFIAILYSGIKILFNIKTRTGIGLLIFLMWIGALFGFVGMSFYHAKPFFHWRTFQEYVELPTAKYDTLFVDIPQHFYTDGELEAAFDRVEYWGFHDAEKWHKKSKKCRKESKKHKRYEYGCEYKDVRVNRISPVFFYKENKKSAEQLLLLPTVDGWRSINEDNFGIDIQKDAAGNTWRNAYRHAQEIEFNYILKDSLLIIEPFSYMKEDKWDGELIRLHFQVPEGKTIVFGKAFNHCR